MLAGSSCKYHATFHLYVKQTLPVLMLDTLHLTDHQKQHATLFVSYDSDIDLHRPS